MLKPHIDSVMGHLDSRTIANWFIRRARRDRGRSLTNMQLQKLVYFAHGWALGLHGDPLVKDPVQAWEFGPVIPKLYASLSKWGAEAVTDTIPDAPKDRAEPYEEEVMEQVYEAYAGLNASALSALTHKKGTPWAQVYEPGQKGTVIDPVLIADHFSDLAARYSEG